MSHELRNPLNSMCAQKVKVSCILKQLKEFSSKLKSDYKNEIEKLISKLDESYELNNSSTDIMVYLIQNMQDYAHIKMGKFNLSLKEFDIKKAIEDVVNIQEYKASSQGISLSSTFDGFKSFKVC